MHLTDMNQKVGQIGNIQSNSKRLFELFRSEQQIIQSSLRLSFKWNLIAE